MFYLSDQSIILIGLIPIVTVHPEGTLRDSFPRCSEFSGDRPKWRRRNTFREELLQLITVFAPDLTFFLLFVWLFVCLSVCLCQCVFVCISSSSLYLFTFVLLCFAHALVLFFLANDVLCWISLGCHCLYQFTFVLFCFAHVLVFFFSK